MKIIKSLMIILLFSPLAPGARAADPGDYRPHPHDIAQLEELPPIGKWMLTPDLEPAHWLGQLVRGKKLREPINVIVIDRASSNENEAKQRFLQACMKAGFPLRRGHSSGYWAWIGEGLEKQFPDKQSHAFSDQPFEINNNHGRFFGPYHHKNYYLFVGALSREKVDPLAKIKHQYVSFNWARDRFAAALDELTQYHITGFINLNNAIIANPDTTTGDHDQMAVLLTADQ